MEAGFTSNKELESAVKSFNKGKVRRILDQMPTLNQKECDYYRYLVTNESSVFGLKPNANLPERLAVPMLIGTPSLFVLSGILAACTVACKKGLDNPQISPLRLYVLKMLYYSGIVLTGASVIGMIALPATVAFHSYYASETQEIIKLLGQHKTKNN